jgi:hypothetical protein
MSSDGLNEMSIFPCGMEAAMESEKMIWLGVASDLSG